ncbi:hypothetical protein J6590_034378 [Homalodisca vitripennis]|nr:hypothetical protein J6590_034378 [Homalodisca vitripennis]
MWTLNMTLMLLCVAAVCLCADTDGSKFVICQRLCASARALTAPTAVCLCAGTDGSKYVGCQVKSIGTTIINS